MNMSYADFLVSDEIITLTANLGGKDHPTYWKKCSHVEFERWRHAEQSEDAGVVERGKQKFIAACIVNQDGSPGMTAKESIGLTAEGVSILFPLALEASGIVNRPEPKNDSGEAESNT